MDCSAYCTASSYDLSGLFNALHGQYKTTHYRDVVHIEANHHDTPVDIFFFVYGATVCWGVPLGDADPFLKLVKKFEKKRLKKPATDDITFEVGTQAKFVEDHLTLPDSKVVSKLAISHGLAQSVKLEVFENTSQKIYDDTKSIPEHLATKGKIPLSRKQIRLKMGELFVERNSINMHVNVLDTPEFFWNRADLEPLYAMVTYELDLEDRVEVLNQRLNSVHELFDMLGTELDNQHSNRLEWAIIWLIVIEVVLTLLIDVFKVV